MQDVYIQKISEGVITDGPATPELWVVVVSLIGALLVFTGFLIAGRFLILKIIKKNSEVIMPIKKCLLLIGSGCFLFALPIIYQIIYELFIS